jgi:hypothetical protein
VDDALGFGLTRDPAFALSRAFHPPKLHELQEWARYYDLKDHRGPVHAWICPRSHHDCGRRAQLSFPVPPHDQFLIELPRFSDPQGLCWIREDAERLGNRARLPARLSATSRQHQLATAIRLRRTTTKTVRWSSEHITSRWLTVDASGCMVLLG